MTGSFIDKNGRKWSPEERAASYEKTQTAIKNGVIRSPMEMGCERCKQKQGIIHYHNHDYRDPVKFLEPVCFRCHQVLHAEWHSPEECREYEAAVAAGAQWPPIYKPDFYVLWRDHGIAHPRYGAGFRKAGRTEPPAEPINRFEMPDFVWLADP